MPAAQLVEALVPQGYLAGVDSGRWYPGLEDVLLVAVTERRTRAQLDSFVEAVAAYLAGEGKRPAGKETRPVRKAKPPARKGPRRG